MDYYKLLGVDRNASQEAIKRAFHSRVLITHPDVNQDNASAGRETQRLIEAYRVLSDPRARRRYDLFSTPVVSDAPAVVYAAPPYVDNASPAQGNRTGVFAVLLALFVGLFIWYQVESNRQPVFRPLLVDGELPYSTSVKQLPVVVEPSPTEHWEWYHTQRYQLSLADPWATERMIRVYRHAARQASSEGDKSRARFYRDAIEKAARIPL